MFTQQKSRRSFWQTLESVCVFLLLIPEMARAYDSSMTVSVDCKVELSESTMSCFGSDGDPFSSKSFLEDLGVFSAKDSRFFSEQCHLPSHCLFKSKLDLQAEIENLSLLSQFYPETHPSIRRPSVDRRRTIKKVGEENQARCQNRFRKKLESCLTNDTTVIKNIDRMTLSLSARLFVFGQIATRYQARLKLEEVRDDLSNDNIVEYKNTLLSLIKYEEIKEAQDKGDISISEANNYSRLFHAVNSQITISLPENKRVI